MTAFAQTSAARRLLWHSRLSGCKAARTVRLFASLACLALAGTASAQTATGDAQANGDICESPLPFITICSPDGPQLGQLSRAYYPSLLTEHPVQQEPYVTSKVLLMSRDPVRDPEWNRDHDLVMALNTEITVDGLMSSHTLTDFELAGPMPSALPDHLQIRFLRRDRDGEVIEAYVASLLHTHALGQRTSEHLLVVLTSDETAIAPTPALEALHAQTLGRITLNVDGEW